jgi:hypothetical protein
MNCLACGSSAMVSGTLIDTSSGGGTGFKIDEVSIWKSMLGIGTRKVRAYGCVHCQHLQLAVEFTEADVDRYQQFEGEQPDVLERINSAPE